MSAQRERESGTDQPGEGAGTFLRQFLVLQVVFLVFLLIASIPEGLPDYARVSATTQMAVIAAVWGLTDLAAVTVETVRERSHRHRTPTPTRP